MGQKSAEIAILLRVQSWSVDEQRRLLGQIVAREEALREDRAALDRELIQEQKIAMEQPMSAGRSYAVYAQLYRDKAAHLDGVIQAVAAEAAAQRDRLADAYKELKVLEQVRKNWLKTEREAAARTEQSEMDEIAMTLHRRSF